jgi:MinD-like ATPase involved in chromosome partitioning or flagellar assembly
VGIMPRKMRAEEKTQSIDDLDALRSYGVSAQMIERLRAVGVISPKHLLLFNEEELMEPLNLSELDTARRVITASRITNAQVVVIDLPASIDDVVVIPALINTNIINLVMDYANYADIVLAELDNSIVRPLIVQLKLNPIVNVVLNKWLPSLDAVESKARAFAHNGEVFVLPTSPIVQYLTSTLKPFVLYEPKGSLERYMKEFNRMINELTRQVKALLGF